MNLLTKENSKWLFPLAIALQFAGLYLAYSLAKPGTQTAMAWIAIWAGLFTLCVSWLYQGVLFGDQRERGQLTGFLGIMLVVCGMAAGFLPVILSMLSGLVLALRLALGRRGAPLSFCFAGRPATTVSFHELRPESGLVMVKGSRRFRVLGVEPFGATTSGVAQLKLEEVGGYEQGSHAFLVREVSEGRPNNDALVDFGGFSCGDTEYRVWGSEPL